MAGGADDRPHQPDGIVEAMTELRDSLTTVPPSLVSQIRPHLPALSERMVNQIQHGVDRYSGPADGRRHKLIAMAVNAALKQFLSMVESGPHEAPRVDDLFRRMGYGEAVDGRDLSAMRSSLRLATRTAWDQLRAFAAEHDLSAAALGALGDALFAYIDHLAEQASIGFETGRSALGQDVGAARERLLTSLVERRPRTELETQALEAAWDLPDRVVVVAVRPDPAVALNLAQLRQHALVADHGDAVLAVCHPDCSDDLLRQVIHSSRAARSAMSWEVPPEEVSDAARWTRRAHALRDQGVIVDQPVIDCLEHRTLLWLHSEPALRRQMCQDMLKPLLAETPNSREILSETLLVWLETRDSAPAIAARLGVHPQTVRYRWKRINELFGEDLRDPETVVQLMMLLKASVPLWKTGDQSDFERYRAEESA